jgi:hypothetical protein
MSEPAVDESSAAMPPNRKGLTITLVVVFVLSMVLGTGPGVLLVNRPEAIGGVPLVYAWGTLWYVVQVVVVLIAYFTIWKSSREQSVWIHADDRRTGPVRRRVQRPVAADDD